MLTVLFRYAKTRIEVIKLADVVEFNPDHGLLLRKGSDEGEQVGFTSPGDKDVRDVFVMNENGATVARYTL